MQIDPIDRGAVGALHRIYVAVGHADDPDAFVAAPLEEVQELLAAPTARFAFTGFLGIEAGRAVASGWCAVAIKDAPCLALLTPRVPPEHRRRGHGTRMLRTMERHASSRGRTLFRAAAVWAAAHGPDGTSSPAVQFAASNGWELALTNTRLTLRLPSDPGRLEKQIAERAARRHGYTTRSWVGPVPNDLLAGWAVLHAAVSADAPHGTLDHQPESADGAAIRDDERILKRSGRVKVNAAAISPAGEVVAYSSLLTKLGSPDPAYQQGTIVQSDHRGRGLGAVVKVQALRLLELTRPEISAVITENAQANKHMLALNRALGYLPVLYSGDFQKHAS